MAKKKGNGWLLNILLLCCVAVMAFSGWKLWGYYSKYKSGEDEYDRLTDYVKKAEEEKTDTSEDEEKPDACPIEVDFDELRQINPEVVGWVYIPDTEVNYPIVQGQDNTYYLHRTFENRDNFTGAIFMDTLCQSDFGSDNSIIYGHNLKTGAMFGYLKRLYDVAYNADADYKEHPDIWVLSPGYAREYTVFAAREISVKADTDVYTVEFGSREEYASFLETQKKLSDQENTVPVDAEKPMITLSTCTSSTEDGRFVVQAILKQEIKQ